MRIPATVKRLIVVSLIAAAVVAGIAVAITLRAGWTGDRLTTALFISGAVAAALGAFGFTGGNAQFGPMGGGSMGRGHQMLAETHALGPDGHVRQHGRDHAGRVSFAWIAVLSGAIVMAAAGALTLTT